MESTAIPIGSTAYGHACAECAKAKTRCMPRASGGNSCQRCHRLNKDCRPAVRVRKPKPLSKTARLEQKMDGLMTLLQSSSAAGDQATPATALATPPDPLVPGQGPTIQQAPLLNPLVSRIHDIDLSTASADEQEEYLRSFRADKLPYLPFYHLPESISAQQLKQESPFFWMCIEATQTKDLTRQRELVQFCREYAARQMVVECHKSLDLLLGLMVHMMWVSHQAQPMSSCLCLYMQLAVALITEMGLNRPPPRESPADATSYTTPQDLPHFKPPMTTVRTMSQRRAVIGCYILSSIIAHFLGRMDPMRWTTHLSECLDVLAESTETEYDHLLVHMARIRMLVDKSWLVNIRDFYSSDNAQAPVLFHLASFKWQLDELKTRIPDNYLSKESIKLHLFYAEFALFSPALKIPLSSPEYSDPKRLDYLYACLIAIKQFLDIIVTLPPAAYASLSIVHFSQTSTALITLFYLSILELPGWDRAAVRRTADVMAISGHIEHQLNQTGTAIGIRMNGLERDAFAAGAGIVRKLRNGWATRLGDVPEPPLNNTVDQLTPESTDIMFLDNMFGWSVDMWFPDPIFGDSASNNML